MDVVLVHGFWDTGQVWRRCVRQLEAQGHRCWVPTLEPRDARTGLVALARQLDVYLRSGPEGPFALVGFSMGTLVARHYLQELGGVARVRAFAAISGPHRGTLTAWLYPGLGTRDMRPGSAFLSDLTKSEACLGPLPVWVYWTPYDLMVFPPASARWKRGSQTRVNCWLHARMVAHPSVLADLTQRLDTLERLDAGPGISHKEGVPS